MPPTLNFLLLPPTSHWRPVLTPVTNKKRFFSADISAFNSAQSFRTWVEENLIPGTTRFSRSSSGATTVQYFLKAGPRLTWLLQDIKSLVRLDAVCTSNEMKS